MIAEELDKTNPRNILIIEDDPDSLRYLILIVEDVCTPGDKVYGCTNLEDAEKYMHEHCISLFLVDIMLENDAETKSGFEFVKKIRQEKEYAFTPVIFVTGLEEPRESAYKELHCYGYIQKPFLISEIQGLIKRSLAYPVKEKPKRLRLKKSGIYILLEQAKIVYIKAVRKHMYLQPYQQECMEFSYMPLADVLKDITDEKMLICEKGIAVNKRYVDYINLQERKIYLVENLGTINVTKMTLKDIIHSNTDIKTQ